MQSVLEGVASPLGALWRLSAAAWGNEPEVANLEEVAAPDPRRLVALVLNETHLQKVLDEYRSF